MAAKLLGCALADGRFGMSRDKAEAIHWLEVAVRVTTCMHMNEAAKTEAQRKLQELKAATGNQSS